MSCPSIQSPYDKTGELCDFSFKHHARGEFNDGEIIQLEREAKIHATELVKRYPTDTDEGTFGCSKYIKECVITQDNIDPPWNNQLLLHLSAQLLDVNGRTYNNLSRKVSECILYRPGGGRLNKK